MAISYNLDLATSLPLAEVSHELHRAGRATGVFDASATPEELLEEGVTTRHSTWIRVVEAKPQPYSPVITDLGFTPTVWVTFRLDKESDFGQQQDDMVQLVSRLLDRISGDAVLHADYEHIWLLRRAGELSVSERNDLWPPHRLASLSQSYSRATHTFSEE